MRPPTVFVEATPRPVSELSVEGHCDGRFLRVRDAFVGNFTNGYELGASLCIHHRGERVVDLWAGVADEDGRREWSEDTLVNVASTGKGFGVACIHLLVARGQLDLDAPVAEYWPEFGQAGKEQLPVRWLLSHRAGLAAISRSLPIEAFFDWDRMCKELAAQKPWWEPGTDHGYHMVTFGWLIGELVRRIDGRPIETFFREELAEPLGVDAHLSCPPEMDARIADLVFPPSPRGLARVVTMLFFALAKRTLTVRAVFNPPALGPGIVNSRAWRAAGICSATAHANGRAISRFYAALGAWTRGDSFESVQLIDQAIMEEARKQQSQGMDRVIRREDCFALGYMLPSPMRRFSDNPKAFGHPGGGGSLGFADPENQLAFGYAMNRGKGGPGGGGGGDPRWFGMISAMYDAVGCGFTPPGS